MPTLRNYLPPQPPRHETYEVWDQGFADKAPAPRPGYHYLRCYQSPPASNYFIFVYEKDQEKEESHE